MTLTNAKDVIMNGFLEKKIILLLVLIVNQHIGINQEKMKPKLIIENPKANLNVCCAFMNYWNAIGLEAYFKRDSFGNVRIIIERGHK